MTVFLNLLKREFSLFWKNKVLVVLFLGAPMFYGILLGYVYSKGKVTDLPIVVVDQDNSVLSKKIMDMLEDNEVVSIAKIMPDKFHLSQTMIDENAACAIIISENFEQGVYSKKYPELTTIVNTSNVLTANYASSAINKVLSTLKAGIAIEALTKQGMPRAIAMQQYEPFKMTFIKKNNRGSNYMYFLWPGVLGTVLQQVLFLGLALSFAAEYENNTFGELIEKSTSALLLLSSKIIPYLLMSIGVWICYIVFAFWFRMPLHLNIFNLTLVTGVFVLSASCIGVLVSVILPTQLKATEVLMVIATPSFILSGFTWPLSQMPIFIQVIANLIPTTHYLHIVKVLIVENGTLVQVATSIYALLAIGMVCGLLAYVILNKKIKKIKI